MKLILILIGLCLTCCTCYWYTGSKAQQAFMVGIQEGASIGSSCTVNATMDILNNVSQAQINKNIDTCIESRVSIAILNSNYF